MDVKLPLDAKILANSICADGEENRSGSDKSLRLRKENNDLRKKEAMCNFQWT